MRRPSPEVLDWAGLGLRLTLAGVLLVAGGLKLANVDAAANAVRAYQLFDYDTARLVAIGLPVLEVTLGLALAAGLLARLAAAGAGMLMVVFSAGIISAWARGLHIDCGCFGSGGVVAAAVDPRYYLEVVRDLALAAAGGWLTVRPARRVSLDAAWGWDTPPA